MYYVYTGRVEYIHTYHATLCNGIMVVWVLAIYIVWYTLHTNITSTYATLSNKLMGSITYSAIAIAVLTIRCMYGACALVVQGCHHTIMVS